MHRTERARGSRSLGAIRARSPHDDQAVNLLHDAPAVRRLGHPEQVGDHRRRTGASGPAGETGASVVKGNRSACPHVRVPDVPVFSARLRTVVPVDEDQINLRAMPVAPNILTAGNVPARLGATPPRPAPDSQPGRGRVSHASRHAAPTHSRPRMDQSGEAERQGPAHRRKPKPMSPHRPRSRPQTGPQPRDA